MRASAGLQLPADGRRITPWSPLRRLSPVRGGLSQVRRQRPSRMRRNVASRVRVCGTLQSRGHSPRGVESCTLRAP